MAIKILGNSVSPDRRSPNTGGITIDTGASEFNQTVAQFGKNASDALLTYASNKQQAEYKLKSTEADIAIEESIKNLQRDMLSPTNDLDPTLWGESFLSGAEEIRQTMLSQTDSKPLQQSINASWSKHYNNYEKDIYTESTARVNKQLSAVLTKGMDNAASALVDASTLDQVSIGLIELEAFVEEYFKLGKNQEGETPSDYYERYIGDVISKRLMQESADMTLGQVKNLYDVDYIEGHEILSAIMKFPGIDKNNLDELIDAAIVYKNDRLQKLNSLEQEANEQAGNILQSKIINADSLTDPTEKLVAFDNLKKEYFGNDDAIAKIVLAQNTDVAKESDTSINLAYEKLQLIQGQTSFDRLLEIKPYLSQADFADLEKIYLETQEPGNKTFNYYMGRFKSTFYGGEDAFIELLANEQPELFSQLTTAGVAMQNEYNNRLLDLQPGETHESVFLEMKSKMDTMFSEMTLPVAEDEFRRLKFSLVLLGGDSFNNMTPLNAESMIKSSGLENVIKTQKLNKLIDIKKLFGDDILERINASINN